MTGALPTDTAIPGQWERVFATAILVGIGLLASHLWARYLARGEISSEKRRIHLVWARNVIWFVIFLIIVSVWASTIAGFALSLAVVTGDQCIAGWRFALHAIRIPIPEMFAQDLERVEAAAMAAAEQATKSWREEAIAHFRKISKEHFIGFPSGKTKVLWDFSDPDHLVLVVRVACPSKERSKVEQLVFKDTWRNLAELRQ